MGLTLFNTSGRNRTQPEGRFSMSFKLTFAADAVGLPGACPPQPASGRCERGIVLGGSGNGEGIAANRHRGVRCAVCWDEESARLARSHNDANLAADVAQLFGHRQRPPAAAVSSRCCGFVTDAPVD